LPVPSCVVAIDRHEGEPSLHRADRLADGLATTVGPPEAYTGTLTIVGVDVGFTTSSAIVWGVFTDTNRFRISSSAASTWLISRTIWS